MFQSILGEGLLKNKFANSMFVLPKNLFQNGYKIKEVYDTSKLHWEVPTFINISIKRPQVYILIKAISFTSSHIQLTCLTARIFWGECGLPRRGCHAPFLLLSSGGLGRGLGGDKLLDESSDLILFLVLHLREALKVSGSLNLLGRGPCTL